MASATPLSSASGSGGLPADVAALFETFAGKPQAPIKFYEKNAASKHSHVAHGVLHCSNAAQMTWMRPPTQGLFRPAVGGAQRGGQRCLSP
jgi:hypothetical protein